MIYNFNTSDSPTLGEVGGKAKNLIASTQAGLQVPGGLALTVSFFEDWTTEIKSTTEWKELLQNPIKENCETIKQLAEKLSFTSQMEDSLFSKLSSIGSSVFAVRSSSPEEDLTGASFAGMYETYLGTTEGNLKEIIAKAYSSMFGFRVIGYKAQNNIDLNGTSISVIVQKQIASDESGIAFSINPLNNCYDEIAINASFGLGEAVVAGTVTPDQYIVEKTSLLILDKQINEKKLGIYLKQDGGIEEKEITRPTEQVLTDSKIQELSELIHKTETYFGFPVDTEWAFENDQLYLLQARPITTHLTLFPELVTEPGEPKAIYIDMMSLTQGFNKSMSPLGMEIFSDVVEAIKGEILIKSVDGTAPALHGRQYLNISNIYKGAGQYLGKKMMKEYDGNVRRIFGELDMSEYTKGPTPKKVKGLWWGLIAMTFKMLPSMLKALFSDYNKVVDKYNESANDIMRKADKYSSRDDIGETIARAIENTGTIMNEAGIIVIGLMNMRKFKKMFKGEDVDGDVVKLTMNLKGNVTSEMGYAMFDLASSAEFKATTSREEFEVKINSRSYSDQFIKAYEDYMQRFGARGFMEIDVATPRTWEDIGVVYDKLIEINTEDSQLANVKEQRQAAYDKLLAIAKKKGKEKKFAKAAKAMQDTFGYREHPKYVIVYVTGKLHNVLLEVGEEFTSSGRLENKYQIFDLYKYQIAAAREDQSIDIKKQREENLRPYKETAHVKDWPLVIDSRGKIFKPVIQAKDGELIGDPISPGKIRGRAKVLNSPYEKPLNPGEILITKATEPSWTPIFINAAGVIMEIGGPLQHGAIIAREYGIPCVSALIGIMEIVKDGDLIELDGTNGIVKIIKE